MKYCEDLFKYKRFSTREVSIGDTPLGHTHPIRLQSMTTTPTLNTAATVAESIRMIEAGCEYVRITAPSMKEAKNLSSIKKSLRKKGYTTPLIADIHYKPRAAEIAARMVEKVRINPGNYIDKKKFQLKTYTDADYVAEIDRIRKKFTPLIHICKEYGTALRIGTNHGSLSDRIMSRYGDTPIGMVESALEFVRICEEENFYDIVLSMKASNPKVMVYAYRMLVAKMMETDRNYPIHLGVTEAGEADDGRIKSAIGIGALLEDGIGDTVRVSLTEPPENEMPAAKKLVKRYNNRSQHRAIPSITHSLYNPFEYRKRKTTTVEHIGGDNPPVVIVDFSKMKSNAETVLQDAGALNKMFDADALPDFILFDEIISDYEFPNGVAPILPVDKWKKQHNTNNTFPLFTMEQ